MELDLKFESWPCLLETADITLRREESLETIVPDALPDIGTVLSTPATPMLDRYLITGNTLHCDGRIAADVIYQAEGDEAICSLHVTLPVRISSEVAGLDEGCRVHLCCCLDGLTVRVMNPRKILVSGNFLVRATLYRSGELRYSSGIEAEQSGIQTRFERRTLAFVSSQTEKRFPLEDEVALGTGRQQPEELLGIRAVVCCTESRIAGSRLIFKGALRLECRLRLENGGLDTQWTELPVSQVLDAGSAGEEANALVRLSLTELETELLDGDRLALRGEILASAVLYDARTVSLLTDAYSTRSTCTVRSSQENAVRLAQVENHVVSFRQVVDVETLNTEVLDQQVTFSECVAMPQGETVCRLRVSAVLQDESGSLTRVERICDVPLETEGDLRTGEVCLTEGGCLAAAGGMEVRGKLHILRVRTTEDSYSCLSSFTLADRGAEEERGQPSAILRKLRPGETLWDVAKVCRATVDDIMTVNQISDEGQARERFLLIPRSR